MAQPVNLRHPTLKDSDDQRREYTAASVALARNLITQGGWELDDRKDRNTDDVKKALKDAKPAYVGGDQGSRDEGGSPPPAASGRAPTPQSQSASNVKES